MIKLIYCITKKAGLPDEEFFRYWANIHGPIGGRIPRLRRLVQSHHVTVPGDKYQSDYDGMAELWFDDMEALLAARQTPEWKASAEDEENFIDHKKVAYFVSEEHRLKPQEDRAHMSRLKPQPARLLGLFGGLLWAAVSYENRSGE